MTNILTDHTTACARQECDYFWHYRPSWAALSVSEHERPPELGHDAFHEAVRACDHAQQAVLDWYEEQRRREKQNPAARPSSAARARVAQLEEVAAYWEKMVCA